jgi:hypothetical protein
MGILPFPYLVNTLKNIPFQNFDGYIKHETLSSGHLQKLFKLYPFRQNKPAPGVMRFPYMYIYGFYN